MNECPVCGQKSVESMSVCVRCGESLGPDLLPEANSTPEAMESTPIHPIRLRNRPQSDGAAIVDANEPSTVKLNQVPIVESMPDDPSELMMTPPHAVIPPTIYGPGLTISDVQAPAFPPEAPTHRYHDHVMSASILESATASPAAGGSAPAPVTMPVSAMSSANPTVTPMTITPLAQPKLIVLRGERVNVQYPIYEGKNFIGRTDDKPVDIDLENQEPADRIWTSRQHAVITYENGALFIEDLNSLNGTFVNRTRVHPGQQRALQINDIVQIGTVQLKVIFG